MQAVTRLTLGPPLGMTLGTGAVKPPEFLLSVKGLTTGGSGGG